MEEGTGEGARFVAIDCTLAEFANNDNNGRNKKWECILKTGRRADVREPRQPSLITNGGTRRRIVTLKDV